MFHTTFNRMFSLFILFALLASTLAMTPATASPLAEPEQPAESLLAAQSVTGVTTRVSVASDGTQANNLSDRSSISADGRYVAFSSGASNFVPGDTNGYPDIFVHNLVTGTTTRVSVDNNGTQANNSSGSPSISADGRYVAFSSSASNLVSGDTNGIGDVFVHDRVTGATTRISVTSNGTQANRSSAYPSISADGRYVAFFSESTNLIPGDTNERSDVFVHDRETGATIRVSVASNGAQANYQSSSPTISADGRYVAFSSTASNLIPGDTNGMPDIFIHDRVTGETTRVSVASDGTQANGYPSTILSLSISPDGRYVAFPSYASNLVPGDTNGSDDVFVHDRETGTTTRVSVASDGTQANSGSVSPSISADGRYVAFYSASSNLVPGDTNETLDVFIHDRMTGATIRVSVASDGTQANDRAYLPSISADGRYVAFTSYASNLVPDDTNETGDIFVYDRGATFLTPSTQKKPPVILVHGWQGSAFDGLTPKGYRCSDGIQRYSGDNSTLTPDEKLNDYSHIAEWLQQDDNEVWIAHLESDPFGTDTLEKNARCLKQQIEAVWSANPQPISMISHSMGGLVSRGAIRLLPADVQVKSLYTLGSPHAGIPLQFIGRFVGLPIDAYCLLQPAVCQMSPVYTRIYNNTNPNLGGIEYAFFAGDGGSGPISWALHAASQGPNDGLVGQYSALGWAQYDDQVFVPTNWVAASPPGQYFTHETHPAESKKSLAYYVALEGEYSHSQSYRCIRDLMVGLHGSANCTGLQPPSAQAMSAAPRVTSFETVAFTDTQTGSLEVGQSVTFPLEIDANGETIFYLNWGGGAAPDFSLVRPDLLEITPQYAADNPAVVTYESGDGTAQSTPYQAYHFPAGMTGTWQVSLTATSDPIDYQVFAMLDSSRTFAAELDKDTYQIGETATLSASLTNDGIGLDGATVTAAFTSPDGTQTDLILTDNLDGTYTTTYPIPATPGYLSVSLTASGEDDGVAYTRSTDLMAAIAPDGLTLTDTYNEEALDEDSNGLYESLAFDLGLELDEAGAYAVSAELYAGDQLVTQAGDFFDLEAGSQTIRLLFDGQHIRESGLDGPYTITNLYLTPLDVGILAGSAVDVLQTGSYQHDQFGATPPAAFSKLLTEDGVTLEFLSTLLMWGGSDGAVTYEYCLDTSDNDACDTSWESVVDSIFVTLPDLDPDTTYHWQVRAVNRGGHTEADGGDWWSFTTVPDSATAFSKSTPVDGATSVSLSSTLEWTAFEGATSYEYCYSSAPGPCTKWNSVGTDTSITLSGLAPNYTYYWQARAVDAGGTTEADGGTWWSFTTTSTLACTWPSYTPPAAPTFDDVPMDVGHWSWVERLANSTITAGCGAGNYCPFSEVVRAQMAIFLLRGKHCGSSYAPPAVGDSTGFGDVPLDATYAPWVKQLAAEGVTAGCGGGNFCPLQVVNRAQMAIFLLRAKHGATYSPPAVGATTGFGDVPLDASYAAWVKQLAVEGVTAGCGNGNFCPLQNVNRAQMATFLVRAFGLP